MTDIIPQKEEVKKRSKKVCEVCNKLGMSIKTYAIPVTNESITICARCYPKCDVVGNSALPTHGMFVFRGNLTDLNRNVMYRIGDLLK